MWGKFVVRAETFAAFAREPYLAYIVTIFPLKFF
jgi:hypothetical protein